MRRTTSMFVFIAVKLLFPSNYTILLFPSFGITQYDMMICGQQYDATPLHRVLQCLSFHTLLVYVHMKHMHPDFFLLWCFLFSPHSFNPQPVPSFSMYVVFYMHPRSCILRCPTCRVIASVECRAQKHKSKTQHGLESEGSRDRKRAATIRDRRVCVCEDNLRAIFLVAFYEWSLFAPHTV